MREVLEDERFKDVDKRYKQEIDSAVSDVESAIYNIDYIIQDLLEGEKKEAQGRKSQKGD